MDSVYYQDLITRITEAKKILSGLEEEKIRIEKLLGLNLVTEETLSSRELLRKKLRLPRLPKIYPVYQHFTYNPKAELKNSYRLASFFTEALVPKNSSATEYLYLPDSILKEVQKGDIIKMDDYEALGLYFVFVKDGEYQYHIAKTVGSNGNYLPFQALNFLKKYNLETYQEIVEDLYANEIPIVGIKAEGSLRNFKGGPPQVNGIDFFKISDC